MRQAASLLGKLVLGPAWDDRLLDQTPEDGSVINDIRRDLYAVVSSGKVTCVVHQGGDPRRISMEETSHPHFDIDLKENQVRLGQLPGEHWVMEINGSELSAFLESHSSPIKSEDKFERCLQWLINEMRGARQKKDDVFARAKALFQISRNSFDRAWAKAKTETGTGWDKGGRHKSSN